MLSLKVLSSTVTVPSSTCRAPSPPRLPSNVAIRIPTVLRSTYTPPAHALDSFFETVKPSMSAWPSEMKTGPM